MGHFISGILAKIPCRNWKKIIIDRMPNSDLGKSSNEQHKGFFHPPVPHVVQETLLQDHLYSFHSNIW